MRKSLLWVGLACAGAVQAADKPVLAPPGAWVHPASLPAADAKLGEAAIRILLTDQQLRLSPQGDELYFENAIRLQTPQGLAALGTISLPWKPDTMTLTVHKMHIVRDGKVIDMLANGREFVVLRRENDLEHAVLDGVLTATLQPEGLQVGDIVDMAYTMKSADPALHGMSQGVIGGAPMLPVGQYRARALWASGLPVHWRTTGAMPAFKETRANGLSEIAFTETDARPAILPRGAPPRFAFARGVELTSFRTWQEVATLFAPLYAKAATLGAQSPLQAEVARIRAASPDPARRAELALALAQDQVRYVALAMDGGGLVPAAADQTWTRRFGDCKGKTVLLMALLHALGIEAEPALVSARLGDGLDERLPGAGLFDHVLVRTTIAGRTYWLDGTRNGDRRLADIDVPPFRWALPVRADGGPGLVRLEVQPPTRPLVLTTIRIDASKGVEAPAPAHVERVTRGDGANTLKLAVANLAPDARERELKTFWRGEYALITPEKVDARFDEATGEETLVMDGTAKLDWAGGRYQAEDSGIGYDADFTRDPGAPKDAPFAVSFPLYSVTRETVLLPDKGRGFGVRTHDIDTVVAGTEYRRRGRVSDGAFVAETSLRSVAPEFAAKEATTAQATLRGFKDEGLFLLPPPKVAAAPKTAAEFLTRAWVRQRDDAAGARDDIAHALALDPRSDAAFGMLAGLELNAKNLPAAKAAADRALAINPNNALALNAHAALAVDNDPKEGARLAGLALAADPGILGAHFIRCMALVRIGDAAAALPDCNSTVFSSPTVPAYMLRAAAYRALRQRDRALSDLDEAIRLDPHLSQAYLDRANIYSASGDKARALGQAELLMRAAPDDPYAFTFAGAILDTLGSKAEADKAFARSIAIRPTEAAYLTRGNRRPREDHAGRLADAAAALKVEPKSFQARALQAHEALAVRDYPAALEAVKAMEAQGRGGFGTAMQFAVIHARMGQSEAAQADIAAARKLAGENGPALNNLCWTLATADVALPSALTACDGAVAKAPGEAAFLDSRAFVLLRLGRPADAIAAYDAALKIRSDQAESLYGRGLAKLAQHDEAGGRTDLAAALKADPRVAETFAGYGLPAPPGGTAVAAAR